MISRLFTFGVLSAGLCLAACAPEKADEQLILVNTLMMEELDPAVDGIWDKGGYILTPGHEESLFPETDEEWAEVAASAEEVAAVAMKLSGEPYAMGREDWIEISEGLVAAAYTARDAANAQDKDAVFNAGGHIYRVCLSCHERYARD
ncbi:MAG: hypothetical protein ACRBEQ_04485 [Hyphomonas sp.]